jgi:CopG family transcriptional regulator, nickel-responsive regulator
MPKVARVSISLEDSLLGQFESFRATHGYPSRSEAVKSLIRQAFIEEEWQKGKDVAGTISIVYDHHKRGITGKLVDVQHDFGNLIVCTQHIHLDHHNCMEVIVVRGRATEIRKLLTRLESVKGIKHSSLMMATTGKGVE